MTLHGTGYVFGFDFINEQTIAHFFLEDDRGSNLKETKEHFMLRKVTTELPEEKDRATITWLKLGSLMSRKFRRDHTPILSQHLSKQEMH